MAIIVEEIIMRIVFWVLAGWGIELDIWLETAVCCMRIVIWLLAFKGMQYCVVEMEDAERRVRRAVRAARAELQAQEVHALRAEIAALRGARGVEHLLEEAHARGAREVE
jgi:hypothetical protein